MSVLENFLDKNKDVKDEIQKSIKVEEALNFFNKYNKKANSLLELLKDGEDLTGINQSSFDFIAESFKKQLEETISYLRNESNALLEKDKENNNVYNPYDTTENNPNNKIYLN